MTGRTNVVNILGGGSEESYDIINNQTQYVFPTLNAAPGEFIESEETMERQGTLKIVSSSGKSVPYNFEGRWSVKCVFIMPKENVTITLE